MKKSLLCALTLACSLSFFSSCSKDEPGNNEDWKAISKEYKEHVGVGTLTTAGSVKVDATSAEKATITLNNIVVGEEVVTVADAALRPTEKGYAFEGSANATTCDVKVTGIIEGDSVNVKVDRTVKTDLPETIKLQFIKDHPNYPGTEVANVHLVMTDANGKPNMLGQLGAGVVGLLIRKDVENVTVSLPKTGAFSVSYKEVGKDQPTVMPPATVAELVKGYLTWFEKDGHFSMAVHQDALTIIAGVAPEAAMIVPFLKQLPKSGDYYTLPITLKKEAETYTFYFEKAFIMQIIEIVKPLVENNPQFGPIFGQIYPMLASSKTLEFGLVFEK